MWWIGNFPLLSTNKEFVYIIYDYETIDEDEGGIISKFTKNLFDIYYRNAHCKQHTLSYKSKLKTQVDQNGIVYDPKTEHLR